MNKSAFLGELKQHLKVLDESEQRDILDEYSVHIDMKMEKGMSEEEAIRDFGDTRKLAEDILEAYHLNPRYANGKSSVEKVQEKAHDAAAAAGGAAQRLWQRGKAGLLFCWQLLLRGGKAVWRMLLRGAAFVRRGIRAVWLWLCGCGRKLTGGFREASAKAEERNAPASRTVGAEHETERAQEAPKGRSAGEFSSEAFGAESEEKLAACAAPEKGQRKKGVLRMLGDMLGKMGDRIRRAVRWTLRWCWNLMLLGMAAIAGFSSVCLLFLLGLLTVFAVTGYPFWGLTVTALGGFLSSASLTLLLYRGIRRKKKASPVTKLPEGGNDGCEEKAADGDEFEEFSFSVKNQEVFNHA